MRCSNCKTENPDGLKFCTECGAAFKTPCASCGFENVPAAKFCGQCGAALVGTAPAGAQKPSTARATAFGVRVPAEQTDAFAPLDGERKTITVFFGFFTEVNAGFLDEGTAQHRAPIGADGQWPI